MTEKQQLGPEQEEWVSFLEANPEKQYKRILGKIVDGELKMCCLGAKVVLDYKREGKEPLIFTDSMKGHQYLYTKYNGENENTLKNMHNLSRFEEIGLKDESGTFWDGVLIKNIVAKIPVVAGSLTHLNDFGWTWTEIAAMIRANPAKFFNKVA